MSSTEQATSPTSNVKFIINALADYAKEIGIDLVKRRRLRATHRRPIGQCLCLDRQRRESNSLEAVLELLYGREKVLDESLIAITIFFEIKSIEVAIGD